jgi:hypothetical protein
MQAISEKAKRTVVQITECEVVVDGFLTPDGEYVMSQRDVARSVKISDSSLRDFLEAHRLEHPSDERFNLRGIIAETGAKGGQKINAVTLDAAHDFWFTQAFKGNKQAQALVYALGRETLLRRFDKAFAVERAESEYRQQTTLTYQEKWNDFRQYARWVHTKFALACKAYFFDAAKVHNLITVGVCGKTAAELRMDELVGTDPNVGLDHIKNAEVLRAVAEVKEKFSGMQKGDATQRVKKAIKIVLKGKTYHHLFDEQQQS